MPFNAVFAFSDKCFLRLLSTRGGFRHEWDAGSCTCAIAGVAVLPMEQHWDSLLELHCGIEMLRLRKVIMVELWSP